MGLFHFFLNMFLKDIFSRNLFTSPKFSSLLTQLKKISNDVLLEWNTYFSNDKAFSFLASEAYSAFLIKTTITKLATTSKSPLGLVTCIPKLSEKWVSGINTL